jgi:GNAT superfamily N-acetyltransferase
MRKSLTDYFAHDATTVRRTQAADVDKLVAIVNDAYAYQDEAKGKPRTNPSHLRKRIAGTDFYTVLHEDKIIGCVYLEPKGSELHFGLLTLAPEFRGKGIAASIIRAIEAYAKDNGFGFIDLDYMSLAPWLKKYYEKYGFTETGEVEPWGAIDLVRMQKKSSSS